MKSGPILAMCAMLLVGVWLVLGPQIGTKAERTDGASRFEVIVGSSKVEVEVRGAEGGGNEFRFLNATGFPDAWLSESEFATALHVTATELHARHWVLKLFNVSGWGMMVWIAVGLGGQVCFFGRMLIQWVMSEKQRASVIPPLFWWLSFFGGVALFTYFVWRKDVVGVLGQSTGIVIYARNLRLIHKQTRRAKRAAMAVKPDATDVSATPEPALAG